MCAICGVFDPHGIEPTTVSVVETMREAMRHRGPDDAGAYHDQVAALGVRRLSIIDVAGGHQPIPNEDRTVWVALNGEIYNHRELRQRLESTGHRFTTQSDAEVVVHLYEQQGEHCVESLRGMFGLVVWDTARRRLVLARDRLGIKPLYYTQRGTALWFASELTALLRHPEIPRALDLAALDQYLCHEYVPTPRSIIQGVRKVPPAHRLIADAGGIQLERYWQVPQETRRIPPAEAGEQFQALLAESVGLHLQSDVPLGVWLSGGLDSSAVLALAMQQGGRPLPTFTIGFEESSFDETGPARMVAETLGTPHTVHRLTSAEAIRLVDEAIAACDEPLGDSSLVATYALSRLARRHVTVALSGDGGDELLGGYPTYYAHRIARYYDRLPCLVRQGLIRPVVERLPVSHANMSAEFIAGRFLRGEGRPLAERHALWMGAFSPEERTALWAPGTQPAPAEVRRTRAASDGDPAEAAMRLDLTTYVPDDLLVKVDRMSMAHGLEVRVPFLDHRLVEFAVQLPASLKVRGVTTKYLARRALRGLLPPAITQRRKQGFGVPVGAWINNGLRPLVHDTLSPRRLRRHGLWNPAYVETLLEQHRRRRRNHGKLLWTLLMFERWFDLHVA